MLTIRSPIWILSALALTASAVDWNGPVSTAVDQGSSTGYSPKPTPPPMPYVGGQSTESLFGVPDLKRAEREDLCGWISTDGNPSHAISCGRDYTCTTQGGNNIVGCCRQGVCQQSTSCIGMWDYSLSCGPACQSDTRIGKCTSQAYPYCGVLWDGRLSMYGCFETANVGMRNILYKPELRQSGWNNGGQQQSFQTSTSARNGGNNNNNNQNGQSSSRTSSTGPQQTGQPGQQEEQQKGINAGAIAGGVVGCLFVLVAGTVAIYYIANVLRSRNAGSPATPEPEPLAYQEEYHEDYQEEYKPKPVYGERSVYQSDLASPNPSMYMDAQTISGNSNWNDHDRH
ncbi:hypothetical protein FPQ18DRAFT_403277 [Pyronema domesticum]|nr:hypothetical protein FPQ18DRAFT_403277 [Pyronema domesticum]